MKNLLFYFILSLFCFPSVSVGALLLETADQWNSRPQSAQGASVNVNGYALHFKGTLKKNKVHALEYRSAYEVPPAQLWAILDIIGEGGEWYSVDKKGNLNPVLKKALKHFSSWDNAWLMTAAPGQTQMKHPDRILAVLAKISGESVLKIQVVPHFDDAKLTPQYIYDGSLQSFANFRVLGSQSCMMKKHPKCELQHLDYPTLKVRVDGTRLQYSYSRPDDFALEVPLNFKNLSFQEKESIVRDWLGYFRHEYSIMVRAFFHSSEGIFNVQPWQWMKMFPKGAVSKGEIQAILEQQKLPSRLEIFKLQTSPDRNGKRAWLIMSCDLGGNYFLDIIP